MKTSAYPNSMLNNINTMISTDHVHLIFSFKESHTIVNMTGTNREILSLAGTIIPQ